MILCSICKKNKAEQEHHILYEPEELKIDICIECHEKIHKHGVGKARNKLEESGYFIILDRGITNKSLPFKTRSIGECPKCHSEHTGALWRSETERDGYCFSCYHKWHILNFVGLDRLQHGQQI